MDHGANGTKNMTGHTPGGGVARGLINGAGSGGYRHILLSFPPKEPGPYAPKSYWDLPGVFSEGTGVTRTPLRLGKTGVTVFKFAMTWISDDPSAKGSVDEEAPSLQSLLGEARFVITILKN